MRIVPRQFISICLLITLLTAIIVVLPKPATAQGSIPATDQDPTFALDWIQTIYGRIEAETVSAPAAARLYAYAGVTLYESVVPGIPGDNTMSGELNGLSALPQPDPDKVYDWTTVANEALYGTMSKLMPITDATQKALLDQHDKVLADRKAALPADVVARSLAQGKAVADKLVSWSGQDNYAVAHNKPYTLPTGDPSLWVETTPGAAPVEPYWGTVRTFALADSDTCAVKFNLKFDTDPNSTFYLQALEVKTIKDKLTQEQRDIADFWRDTPGQTGTPAGHWMLIAGALANQMNLKLSKVAEMYALVGVAVSDSFVSAWELKYKVLLLRPVTYIDKYIQPGWAPYVQTPAFPEYPSGHSVVSGAAAEVLRAMFGSVAFKDTTQKIHGMETRTFTSFEQAASEAAISRMYGGIHFRAAIENGLRQGRCIGDIVVHNVQLRPQPQPGE
jgi:hypothetical protein